MIPIVYKGEESFQLLSEDELTARVGAYMEGKYLKEALMKIGFTKWAQHLKKEFCDKTGIVKIDGYAEPIQSSLKEDTWDEIFSDFEKYVAYKNEDDYLLFKEWVTQTAYKPIEYKQANHEFTEDSLLKILSKHSKNFAKWEKSEKPLYYLQVNGHEAINAMKESSLTPKSIRDSDELEELLWEYGNDCAMAGSGFSELPKPKEWLESRGKSASLKPNKISDSAEEENKKDEDGYYYLFGER